MTLAQLLAEIVDLLERSGVSYMATGSLISSYYGEPRTTRDIDIVIEADPIAIGSFVSKLDRARFYSDLDHSRSPARGSMFNLIDTHSGWKVDLIVRKDRPFSDAEFARRRRLEVLGVDMMVATPEDVILSKMEWARLGGSDRQLDDVRGILRLQSGALDLGYVRRWAIDLGVADLFDSLIDSLIDD